ncbi:MAG: hypothetical protein RL260_3742, partial [Pseudomonadota bacterium]
MLKMKKTTVAVVCHLHDPTLAAAKRNERRGGAMGASGWGSVWAAVGTE